MIDVKLFSARTEAQARAFEDTSPMLLHDGGWFSGKTHVVAAKAMLLGLIYPNNCIGFVRRKRVDLEATLWKWFIDKVLPPSMVVAHNDQKLYRKIKNGTEFFGAGLDSNDEVNKLASREYGFIGVEEATELPEDDFDEKLLRCMRLPTVPFRQLMLICNPSNPGHFLYQRFVVKKLDNYTRIKSTILPDVPPNYQTILDQLTGVFRLRYVDGEWASFEGLVYPFDPQKHIIKSFEIPKDWRRVVAIDFGFDHPFVCQWWAVSPSDKWYLYREIYHSRRTVKTHSVQIKHFNEIDGIQPSIICDHDAEDQATLRENGLITQNAYKDRAKGQQILYDLFEHDQIFYFEDCTVERDMRLVMEKQPASTVDEFPTYIWTNKAKEDMIKEKDDGCFSEDTLITTKDGNKRIFDIEIGDQVLTRKGFREVIDSGCTGIKDVYLATFSDGNSILTTKNHPFIINDKSIPLQAMRYCDIIYTLQSLSDSIIKGDILCHKRLNLLNLTELSLEGIQNQKTGVIETIIHQVEVTLSQGLYDYMRKYGSRFTEKFQQDLSYITKMGIRPIMIFQIFNVLLQKNTANFIQKKESVNLFLLKRLKRQSYGINQNKVENFTVILVQWLTQMRNTEQKFANNVDMNIPQETLNYMTDFVQTSVNQHIEEKQKQIMNQESVPFVQKNLVSINTQRQRPVHVVAVVNLHKKQRVYNLAVDKEHEYFANGILVHNCDANRYAVATKPTGPGLSIW